MKFSTQKFGYLAIITSLLAICMGYTTTYAALDLNFYELATSLQGGTFPVSFTGGGNNFAGALIFNNQTSVNQTITFEAGGSVTCRRQIHGYYYNAARGVGLLPLSSQTQMNDGVTVVGGLYTSCGAGARIYDLVGLLAYKKNGVSIGTGVFGVETDLPTNSSIGTYQPGALSWKVSNGLNGRFFDTMFGIGDMSSISSGIGVIGSLSNLLGIFSDIYIQGHVGIGQSVEGIERESLTINLAGTKTLLTSTDELLSSDILNTVSKNTAKKCRTTTTYTESDLVAENIGTSKFVCIELTPNSTFTIDELNFDLFKNKDIVFLDGNVALDRTLYDETSPNQYLSLYIPNGNLIFDSNIETGDLTEIDNNGFPKNLSNVAVTKGVYLVGNFIVNGLIVGSEYNGTYKSIPFKTFIHGKLVSLNTFTTVSEKREKLLGNLLSARVPNYDTLTSTANPYFTNSTWNASMGGVFAWDCADTTTGAQFQGYGATPIGLFDTETVDAVHSISCPPGHRYPLVIIEKLLNSSFFLK